MSDPNLQQSLLAELDAQQDEVLRQLDELNAEIENLLQQHVHQPEHEQLAAA